MGFISLNCYCGYKYNFQSLIYMIKKMQEKNIKEYKELYQEIIINYWRWKCMICRKSFNIKEKFYRINFIDDKIDKTLLKKILISNI